MGLGFRVLELGFRVLAGRGVIYKGHIGVIWDNGKENGNYYLRFRVWGLRVYAFRVSGSGYRVCDDGFTCWVKEVSK